VPAQYHINHEDEFIAIQLEGDVDLVDVYELCQSLLTDPEFRPALPQLADVRNVDLKVTPGAIRPFLNYVTMKYRPHVSSRIAVVLDGSMDDDFCAGVIPLRLQPARHGSVRRLRARDQMAATWRLDSADVIATRGCRPKSADEHPKQIRA
jgi:hypothetical protein